MILHSNIRPGARFAGTAFIVLVCLFSVLTSFSVPPGAEASSRVRVVIFGDSIAAGYGVDPSQAFPAKLQEIANRNGKSITIVNAGLSGETTAGGARRIQWILRQPVDILMIELGGNDALRGLDPAQTERNLREIISLARAKHSQVKIILAGMKAPPNLGSDFATKFEAIYPRLASELDLTLIPFVLEGVGGEASLNQEDGIHPTPAGHEIIAKLVWPYLNSVLDGVVS